tara:strand:+ start:1667 stop:2509 length:843 start_codon:yes stop_codon:yes gene_type:complete
MNLDVIKQRLETLNSQSQKKSGGGDKKNLFFKPSIGKQVIRVVPSKFYKDNPFTEMKFYYGIGPKMTMASPLNWGDKDPISEFVKQLRQSNDSESWRLAKKLDPKNRVFIPIIVRGEESEGVKLWQFGKLVHEAFLQMASDEEIGDFTDILEGRDIKLNTVGPESTGTKYNKTSIGPSLKVTPLSDDKAIVDNLLEDQIDPMKLFKPLPFDEMKAALQSFLTPDGEEEGEIISEVPEKFDDEPVKSNYSLNAKDLKSKTEKFDDMFSDEGAGEEVDDLPF